jgi:hypothetical protein
MEEGEPEPAEAVDTSTDEETPAAESADEPEEVTDDAEPAEESEEAQAVNFDGMSDELRTTLERLHADGHVTHEEIEEVRLGALRQSDYTKKTQALAEQRKALAAKEDEDKEDLALLERIRSDPQLHEAWMKMSSGDYPTMDGEDGEELVDAKRAEEIAQKAFERREAERQRGRCAREDAGVPPNRGGPPARRHRPDRADPPGRVGSSAIRTTRDRESERSCRGAPEATREENVQGHPNVEAVYPTRSPSCVRWKPVHQSASRTGSRPFPQLGECDGIRQPRTVNGAG